MELTEKLKTKRPTKTLLDEDKIIETISSPTPGDDDQDDDKYKIDALPSPTPSDDEDEIDIDEDEIDIEGEITALPTPTPTPSDDEDEIDIEGEITALPTPSDDEDEDDSKQKGGVGDELENDVTGMKLSNPNPFENRLQKRDPKLFLVKKEGKYNAYSRLCPSNYRRQPVILTDKEKEKIDRENPGAYNEAIKYGSSKDNEHWYICPRYWCLLNNMPLTEEDVKAGKCGGKVIPFGAKKVPKDAYIYEFKGQADGSPNIDKDGNYVPLYPGFTKDDSHPDGLCVFLVVLSYGIANHKK